MKLTKHFLRSLGWTSLFAAGGTLTLLAALYLYLSPQLPSVDSLRAIRFQIPLRVYSSDNKLLGEFGEKRRTPIKYENIPQNYIDAILAAEDDQFYSHNGVSIKGLLRATSQLISTGRIQSGGSTITMQVARNFFLSRRQTFARKFNEILLALKIEREITKPEILELYVNIIFLGNRAYGIEAAAKVYYGKTLSDLSLAQLAMIAGLPKAPSIYNPIVNPERALTRRNWILGRMLSLEKITQQEYDIAIQEPVTAKYHGTKMETKAQYVAEMARKFAVEKFGLKTYTEGYKAYTTINSELQNSAQLAVENGLITYDKRHGYRGAEHNLMQDSPIDPEAPTPNYTEWIKYLDGTPTYGNLTPAAVIAVNEKDAGILFSNGEQGTIFWEQGLSDARAYINENARGPSPKSASDVLKVGDIIRVRLKKNGWWLAQIPAAQAALVALAPENGAILSLVGGFDFRYSHFNRATQALRQPGSNFKPFIYTAALENGMTPATIINDAPIVFDDDLLESTWRPENDSGKFYGPTRLRKALYLSRNLVSIRALRNTGIGNAIETIEKFGFAADKLPRDLSLSLGSYAVTPMDIAKGYAVFANGGYQVEPYLIDKIVDSDGEIVFQSRPKTVCHDCPEEAPTHFVTNEAFAADAFTDDENEDYSFLEPAFHLDFEVKQILGTLSAEDYPRAPKVLSDQVAYIINDMLSDVIKRGTGRKARGLDRTDLAGKTGTTNGPTDAWFSGYQKNVVATTWVGFDQNFPIGKREYGGSAALPIWIDFMRTALRDESIYTPPQPEGIVMVKIDPETGKRARPQDPDAIFEIFREENVPEQQTEDAVDIYNSEESLQEELF